MKKQRFSTILHNRVDQLLKLVEHKGDEYTAGNDNQFHNFDTAAAMDSTTPEKALWGMLLKHLVSCKDMIDSGEAQNPDLIDEKIGDIICYFALLEGIMLRRTPNVEEIPLAEQSETCTLGEEEKATDQPDRPVEPKPASKPNQSRFDLVSGGQVVDTISASNSFEAFTEFDDKHNLDDYAPFDVKERAETTGSNDKPNPNIQEQKEGYVKSQFTAGKQNPEVIYAPDAPNDKTALTDPKKKYVRADIHNTTLAQNEKMKEYFNHLIDISKGKGGPDAPNLLDLIDEAQKQLNLD